MRAVLPEDIRLDISRTSCYSEVVELKITHYISDLFTTENLRIASAEDLNQTFPYGIGEAINHNAAIRTVVSPS
jgi:hypothetical protein